MGDYTFYIATAHLWQVTVLFALIALFSCSRWAKRRSHLMLLLWVLFFVKCLVPPVIQSPVSLMAVLTPSESTSVGLAEIAGISTNATEHDHSTTVASGDGSERGVETPSAFLAWSTVGWIWTAGSGAVLAGFIVNFFVVRRRIFSAVVSSETEPVQNAQKLLSQLKSHLGMSQHDVNLVVSQNSLGPLVFGFWRPTIVLPVEMLTGKLRLKPVIAHELCHVWRRDHLLGFLQIAAQVLFWFHPCVWIASRRINRLCEVCCDDDAMRIFDLNSKIYAGGLLDVLSMQRVVRSVGIAPGIRPVEVTRRRLEMIVANRKPKTRQSQAIVVCVFVCLVIPSLNSARSVALARTDLTQSNSVALMNSDEVAIRRAELDFLLGHWNVTASDGAPAGSSVFAYEKSGKMIREDWTAADGSTAQGITFYDPNEACWKMTWVDSAGSIMESSGQWSGQALVLNGWITGKNGERRKAQTVVSREDDAKLNCELNVEFGGVLKPISRSIYRRKTD